MQKEFRFVRSVTSRPSAAKTRPALDYPLGDHALKPPVKRPRLQGYLWEKFGLSRRKITDSLAGTLSKSTSARFKKWEKLLQERNAKPLHETHRRNL